jgi:hypothetical protein
MGSEIVGKLENGELSDASMDVFESEWLPAGFATARAELMELHWAARGRARQLDGERWASLDPDLARLIGTQMFKRLVSTVRNFGRGGTVVFVPPERTEEFSAENRFVALKYRFSDGGQRRRFRTLIVGTMNRLAKAHGYEGDGSAGEARTPGTVGWREYQESNDQEVAALEEAIMEVAHLVAALAKSDGAVVMSRRYEVLGFGGEISGKLADVETVLRALDVEGEEFDEESTESVGTRHRSAYRLCKELPDVLTVVVSKDGDVRFARQLEGGEVAFWDQA